MVGALVALNSVGSVLMPDGKTYWAWAFELEKEFGGGGPPKSPMDLSDPAPDESRLPGRSAACSPAPIPRWQWLRATPI